MNMRTVQLSSSLCDAAQERFGNRFATVEELLTFLLQELLRDDARKFDHAELSLVERRLKELGYV
jgi:hypothetical protein